MTMPPKPIKTDNVDANWRNAGEGIALPAPRGGYADVFPDACWGWIAQHKLDGWRVTLQIGTRRNWIVGRGKRDGRFKVHRVPFFEALRIPALAGTLLDGELHWPGHGAAEISHAIATGRAAELRFAPFDVLVHNQADVRHLPYSERLDIVEGIVSALQQYGHDWAEVVTTYRGGFDRETAPAFLAERNWEGLVFKDPAAPWGASGAVWKYKASTTLDGVVVGWTERKRAGHPSGRVASLVVAMHDEAGELHPVGSVSGADIPTADAARWVGRVVEFAASGWDGTRCRWCRFVRLRDDKAPADCVLSLQIGGAEFRAEEGEAVERDDRIKQRVKVAHASADAAGLPRLEGTARQIAWAHDIRFRMLGFVDGRLPVEMVDYLRGQASAAWWISHREAYLSRAA